MTDKNFIEKLADAINKSCIFSQDIFLRAQNTQSKIYEDLQRATEKEDIFRLYAHLSNNEHFSRFVQGELKQKLQMLYTLSQHLGVDFEILSQGDNGDTESYVDNGKDSD